MEPGHSSIGNGDRAGGLALASGGQAADAGAMPVVPSGFDEKAADMTVTGLGDGSPLFSAAGGVLTGDQAQEGHETAGGFEAHEAVQLSHQAHGGHGVHPPEAAQSAHRPDVSGLLADHFHSLFQGLKPLLDLFDGQKILVEHGLVWPGFEAEAT